MTPRVSDKVGSYVSCGTELAEVADITRLRARVYVSEYDLYKFTSNSPARFQVDGSFPKHDARNCGHRSGVLRHRSGPHGSQQIQGTRPPKFYVFELIDR